jgi:hypothetical protein
MGTDTVLVELDPKGKVVFTLPDSPPLLASIDLWLDSVLEQAKSVETDEAFFRGYLAGRKTGVQLPQDPTATEPRTKGRRPRAGSMRDNVRSVLAAHEDRWLTAREILDLAPEVLGKALRRQSVYNALLKEVHRGGVVRSWDEGVARYQIAP